MSRFYKKPSAEGFFPAYAEPVFPARHLGSLRSGFALLVRVGCVLRLCYRLSRAAVGAVACVCALFLVACCVCCQDKPPLLLSRSFRSDLCLLLSFDGAHRANPHFTLAPFSPPQRLFFVSGIRSRIPFRFSVLRLLSLFFFCFLFLSRPF